jgi:molecular chaperone DnaJ
MQTFYDILRVSPEAGPEEIRRAFYRLAKQLHPDISRAHDGQAAGHRAGDDSAQRTVPAEHESAAFLKILDAYKVLIDNSKRSAYDRRMGLNGHGRAGTTGTRREEDSRRGRVLPRERVSYALSLRDVLHHPRSRTHRGRGGFVNPKGYDVSVRLTREELPKGVSVLVDVPAHVICPVCRGNRVSCTLCSDRGYVLRAVPTPVFIPVDILSGSVFVVPLREIRLPVYAFFLMKELRVMVRISDDEERQR